MLKFAEPPPVDQKLHFEQFIAPLIADNYKGDPLYS
jgi:hypothetical protein